MKILCIADHVDPIVYSNAIKERFKCVSLVLSAGDLPMDYLGFVVSSLNKPLYFVFGNHNLKYLGVFNKRFDKGLLTNSLRNTTFGSIYVGFNMKYDKKNDLIIMGLGGCKKYNKAENQHTELQMYLSMIRMIPRLVFNKIFRGRYLDILLTHAAPRGIHDKEDPCHVGFKSFLWFMRKFKPKYLLHGHIHLYNKNEKKITDYHNTRVINVYDHYVLDFNREDSFGQ
ncbi:metallophosphoesterase [Thiospirochaeta perfilievii]|uniref:Metallophosphoesterase n=1 Tax=Thiospirochaeta perfilievii TaxID=252967 RepID=A0A5C1QAU6_9SPIO|nr:metallophosphoesterase [Thiospirochaeta perfilievii]QEN04039.1 metallophosphoesterase [Thiospirochaeta perfilievii]